jgi:carboxymethylenebutenolidase
VGLAGVIGFYPGLARNFGGGTLLERAGQIKYPVLALFGGADPSIPPDQVAAFELALDGAGVPHEVVTYPGAPHSFFDRRAADYANASADAWTRVLSFIAAHAGS